MNYLRYGLPTLIIISNFILGHCAKPWSLAASFSTIPYAKILVDISFVGFLR
jgi:hypothetical protein